MEHPMATLRLQIKIGKDTRIGHGKIGLLEEIEKTGSISAAARTVGMTYRRGWELIDQMNRAFGRPVVTGTTGGLGGAEVTALGRDIVAHFRSIEAKVLHIATVDLREIEALVETPEESATPQG
jgi:molybdate transport system regulatory protein